MRARRRSCRSCTSVMRISIFTCIFCSNMLTPFKTPIPGVARQGTTMTTLRIATRSQPAAAVRAQAPATVLASHRRRQSGALPKAVWSSGPARRRARTGLRPGGRHRQDGGLETPALARPLDPQLLPWCLVSLLQPRTAGLAAAPARARTARRNAGGHLAADAGCVPDPRPKARAGLPGAVGSSATASPASSASSSTLDDSLRPVYEAFGVDLLAHNGDSSFELPVPATYLVDRDATVIRRVGRHGLPASAPSRPSCWLDCVKCRCRYETGDSMRSAPPLPSLGGDSLSRRAHIRSRGSRAG